LEAASVELLDRHLRELTESIGGRLAGSTNERRAAEGGRAMNSPDLPALLQGFFTARLRAQLDASPRTVAAYRDTFRLLLRFAAERLKQEPSPLRVEQLDPSFVGEFLRHLEVDRGNSARTRNTRLAALRAFFRYVAVNEPARVLQMPTPFGDAQQAPPARPC